ncbi:MAG: CRISPR-associated endonuclease Cas1 [Candidatus Competibacteraceae bacterium]|nr:CRISPR-associated endonuclease Cas1 [Candidatus Competibacteraceae bacterium]
MAVLYIQEQGVRVGKRNHQVLVQRGKEVLQEVPLGKVDQVVLMGRGVQMSTALLVELMQRGIPVILTNQRGSRHYVTLTGSPSRFGELRSQQVFFVHDEARSLEMARAIVQAKLVNQRVLLAQTGWAAAPGAVGQIDAALARVAGATTVEVVRGYEGAAAAAYFGAWRAMLPAEWGFQGRAFYPPPDPVNALLSFGYTLLLHDVITAVQVTGLDPYLGTFHVMEPGRPSLALDLMEEFRPLVVDRLVLEVIGRALMTRARFERPSQRQEAVYLDAKGREVLVEAYEGVMQSRVPLPSGEHTLLRRVVLLQAYAVARVMRGEQEGYVGYVYGH